MKIKIILSLILASLTFWFHAQVQFSEDFTSPWSANSQGWVVRNNSLPVGPFSVIQGMPSVFSAYNGSPADYVSMNYQSIAANASGGISTWLMTPTLNLANGTTLQFATRVINPITFADRLEIRMSTAGSATALATGTTAIGTFTNLLLTINPLLSTTNTSVVINNAVNGYPAFWAVYTLSVSGLSGPTVGRFAFRYFVDNGGDGPNATNSNFIGLDAVRVVDPPPTVNPCNSITNLTCSAISSFSLNAGPGYLPQQPGAEKIYAYTPNVTGNHTLTLNHNSPGSISLYSDQTCNLASWTNLGAVTTNSAITVSLTSGVTEYFLIDDGNTTSSSGTIKIDCPAPPADPCLSITNLTCSTVNSFTLNAGAGYLPLQPGREKIYSYTPSSTGNHTLTLNHSSPGSVSLYLDPACNAGSAWTNTATITSNSSVSVPMTSGLTQYFLIDDDDQTESRFSITLECAAADPCLSITSLVCESPISFSLAPGQGAWNTTGPGKEKVYSFTPSLTGQYTLSLSNTGQINLFSASACSPSGWAPISSASSGNYTVQLISGALIYILIDGTDGNLASGACTIKCPTQDACTLKNYGASKANSPDDEEIYNVSFGTLNNTSSCSSTVAPGPNSILKQYSNFTGIVTAPVLVPGEQYPLSVTVGECGSSICSTGGISVYIDYNADGSFSGPGENVWSRQGCSATASGKTYSTSITIPSSSPFGYKRMRVIFNCDGLTASTTMYGFGETEDYCVEISPPVGIASEATRKLQVQVSPNPTSGQLHVQLEKNNNYTLLILNTLGQVILSQSADINTNIDLKDMNSGIYFLKVMDKDHTLYTTRIIKE